MTSQFTQQFIEQQKDKLITLRQQILQDIENIKSEDPFNNPQRLIDNSTDDDVQEQSGHMIVEAQVEELEDRLKDIEHALNKIEKGTYGFDEKTGMPISLKRLELVPEARYDIVK